MLYKKIKNEKKTQTLNNFYTSKFQPQTQSKKPNPTHEHFYIWSSLTHIHCALYLNKQFTGD